LNTVQGSFFNTENKITAACDMSLLHQALSICDYFNSLLGKTVPGGDVWAINHARGSTVEVSEHTMRILELALEMFDVSGGRFNIAIGPVISLWGFQSGSADIPAQEALALALANTDCGLIRLSGHSVEVPDGMQIDLGGIAKGYIADRVAEYLRENGVGSALIDLGGNILTIGRKPDGSPWKIGLQVPFIDREYRDKYWSVLECCDESIVTSGIYERGFFKNDRWYHHILDSATGMPVDNGVLSVTVCASSSFLADALTTPLFLLGEREGASLAGRYGVDAAFYLNDNRVILSAGMEKRLNRLRQGSLFTKSD